MVEKNRSHLRLVVDNTTGFAETQKKEPLSNNTIVREFKGPFAHLRAQLAFELFADWEVWQIVLWERFSLLEPKTWFYSRVEASTCLSRDDWAWLESYTRSSFGNKWHLFQEHHFAA